MMLRNASDLGLFTSDDIVKPPSLNMGKDTIHGAPRGSSEEFEHKKREDFATRGQAAEEGEKMLLAANGRHEAIIPQLLILPDTNSAFPRNC